MYFSSLRFLKNVEEKTRNTQKLKHLIILILRCLAFACLVFAFAQPYQPLQENAVNQKSVVQSIFIDNSFSMQAMGMQGELLSEAKEAAKAIVNEAKPNTEFIVLTNSLSATERRLINKQDALDRIDNVRQIPERKALKDVISLHTEITAKENKQGYNQLILLSDFQANQSDLKAVNADSSVFYQLIQLEAQNKENIYIDSVWFSSPLRKVNRNNELNVRVVNVGKEDLKNIDLKLKVDDYERNMLMDIEAEASVVKTFNYTDNSTGFKAGSVEVNDQQIYFDDKFYFAYEVKEGNNIVIINTATSVDNPAWVYETDGYYKSRIIGENQVQREDIFSADLVFLNGLNSISSGQTALFREFTQQGGALVIVPGPEADISSYNSLLSQLKMPSLAPLKKNTMALSKLNLNDPFFEGIFQQNPSNISFPEVINFYPLVSNSAFQGRELMSFQNGSPYLVKSTGNQKVYLVAAPLQRDFSSFINHSLFPTFLLRMGELAQRNNALYCVLGEDAEYTLRMTSASEKAIHLVGNSIDFIPPALKNNQFVQLSLDSKALQQGLQDGIYDIQQDKSLGSLALNYNRKESELQSENLEQIEIQLKAKGAQNVNSSSIVNAEEIAQLDFEKPQTYWRILLFLSLVFLILEMIVIRTKIFK